MAKTVILGAARTPFGKLGGGLSSLDATELGGQAISAALERAEVGPDQVVRQPGKQLFAGSALRPIDGVFRAAEMLQCAWQEVWPRFSTAPARLLGVR